MTKFPTENPVAAAIGLYKDGFTFIMNRRRKFNSDIFKISLPGMDIICFGGEDAARAFYDPDKFVRKGAVPLPIQDALTGRKAIHTTDDRQHHSRKALFMLLMTDEQMTRLQQLIYLELQLAAKRWIIEDNVVLFDAASRVLCKAICTWAGIRLDDDTIDLRASQFVSLVDAFGNLGARHFKGTRARKEVEAWISDIIRDVRAGRLIPEPDSALHLCAFYEESNGNILDLKLAAIELINILRPTVAITWYISFAAVALFNDEKIKEKFKTAGNSYQENFINEVRRFFPFAPFMGAKVRSSFTWKNYRFSKGTLVLLDMYGTNHDDRLWDDPYSFIPERFNDRIIKPFDFLAQGGGDPYSGHRCPGETITVETLKTFLNFLSTQMQFNLPKQNMSYSLSRMPSKLVDGFIMNNIKLTFN